MESKSSNQLTNVASVPMRSPFRYPGGKTWFVPHARNWLNTMGGDNIELIEPFAGGGIVSLTAVFEELVKSATLAEIDEGVAAVWQTILNDGDGIWLADKIVDFNLSIEAAQEAINEAHRSTKHMAFATIVKNRVSRGGILASSARFIKQGENGKGISSRWYPKTLKQRILAIHQHRNKLNFLHKDGLSVIQSNTKRNDVIFFIDPPYYKAAHRLYNYFDIDHILLFEHLSKLSGDFLLTYDDVPEIHELARKWNFETHKVMMRNTHHAKKKELVISRNLDWLTR